MKITYSLKKKSPKTSVQDTIREHNLKGTEHEFTALNFVLIYELTTSPMK